MKLSGNFFTDGAAISGEFVDEARVAGACTRIPTVAATGAKAGIA
jgi:hypothetical protein